MSDADQEIPDIRARRAGVHQISGGFEREPGIEFAERALHVAARELGALARCRPSTMAPASSVAPSVPSVPAARMVSGSSARSSRAAASARWVLRPPRPMTHGQLDRRFAAPDQSVRRGVAQCRRRIARRHPPHRRRSAAHPPRTRARGRRRRRITACTAASTLAMHLPLDGIRLPVHRGLTSLSRSRRRSSPGTSEMNNASARRAPSSRATPPPLRSDRLARRALSCGDVPARCEPAFH